MCRTADRLRRASYLRPSHPGELVDLACIRTRARVARENWSIPRVLGPGRDSSGTAGRNRGPSDPGTSRLGQLVTPWTLPPERGLVNTAGPRTRARVFLDVWSTPSDLRPMPVSPAKAGRRRRHWNQGLGRPGHLVRPAGLRTWAEYARTAGRPRGPLETGPSRPGDLVDLAGHRTLDRIAQDIWSKPRGHGDGIESSRTDGPSCGPSDMRPSPPEELVHTAGTLTRSRVARECWLTPRGLVPGPGRPGHLFDTAGHWNRPISHGRPGQHRGPMGSGPSHAGH